MTQRKEKITFSFDHIFDEGIETPNVFKKTMSEPISNLFQGYNSTILAYGMTGSGKTYTMFGDIYNISVIDQEPGIIFLTIKDIFWRMHWQLNQDPKIRFRLKISFLEIYNEQVKDLLSEKGEILSVLEDNNKDIVIQNLTEIEIKTPQDIIGLIQEGNSRRTMAETHSNKFSSRSHAIFTINFEKYYDNKNEITYGKLALVDLAGSERACVSTNKGLRMMEGANINRSLLALGNCIIKLSEHRNGFIPYRDSKLTRILKESLSGNTLTIMIACISPLNINYEETLNTLKYASRVKKIKGNIVKNLRKDNENDFIIKDLKKEIDGLNKKLKCKDWENKYFIIKNFEQELDKNKNKAIDNLKDLSAKLIENLEILGKTNLKLTELKRINQQYQSDLTEKYKDFQNLFKNPTENDVFPLNIEKFQLEIQNYEKIIRENNILIHEQENKFKKLCKEKDNLYQEFTNIHDHNNKNLLTTLINSLSDGIESEKPKTIPSFKGIATNPTKIRQYFKQKSSIISRKKEKNQFYSSREKKIISPINMSQKMDLIKFIDFKSTYKTEDQNNQILLDVSEIKKEKSEETSFIFDDNMNEHDNEMIELRNFIKKDSKLNNKNQTSQNKIIIQSFSNDNEIKNSPLRINITNNNSIEFNQNSSKKESRINPNILKLINKQKEHLKGEYEKLESRNNSVKVFKENLNNKDQIII